MPFQPIPFSAFGYGMGAGTPPAPAQGQTVAGQWPLSVLDPPRPGERFDLSSIYLPVAVQAASSGAKPTVATITAQLFLSGVLVFQQQADVNLLPEGVTYVTGNAAIASSLQSAVSYRSGQGLAIGYTAQLDQTTSVLWVYLAGVSNNVPGGDVQPLPGSLGYVIDADPPGALTQ